MVFLGQYSQVCNMVFQYIVLSLFISRMFSWITTFITYSVPVGFSLYWLCYCVINLCLSSMSLAFSQILSIFFFISLFYLLHLFLQEHCLSCVLIFMFFWWRLQYIRGKQQRIKTSTSQQIFIRKLQISLRTTAEEILLFFFQP